MAIGGAIGVGLFSGSRVTIRLAGPAVILSYLLGAGIALIMSYALAEMAVVHPVAGAFGVYAEKYLIPGLVLRFERLTESHRSSPSVLKSPRPVSIFLFGFRMFRSGFGVVLVSASLVALNSMQVNRLGEFEIGSQ